MEQQSQWVGIDVSKANLDVYLRPSGQQFQVKNQASGIIEFINQLRMFKVKQVILEATGGLELEVAQALQEQGFAIAIINSQQARDFAKASGKLAKTDRIDATVLAHFGEAMQPAVTILAVLGTRVIETAEVFLKGKNGVINHHRTILNIRTALDSAVSPPEFQPLPLNC
jgi:transposase